MFRSLLIPGFLLATGCALLWSCMGDPGVAAPKGRIERGTFHVSIQERLEDRKTQELTPTDVNVAEVLITRKLVHHGFKLVDDPAKARYLIQGQLDANFHKELNFEFEGQKTLLEHQYKVVFSCSVKDTQKPDAAPERFDIPEMINGRNKDIDARLDIRRRPATIVAQRMVQGKTLGRKGILESMRQLGYVQSEKTFNDVMKELVAHGHDAVPYMIEMLYDERPVRLPGEFPGLEEWNKDSLRYYHIADRVLTEILNRDSAVALDSSDIYMRKVRVGWTWVWEEEQGIPKEFREREEDRKSSVKAGTEPDPGHEPPPIPDGEAAPTTQPKDAAPAPAPKPTTQPKIGSEATPRG